MSHGFPFPSDRLALARSDFCEDPDAAAAEPWDARSCQLRARQCATHVQSTGDRAWARRAVGPVLEPAKVQSWRATEGCRDASVRGACSLLALQGDETDALWRSAAATRIRTLYERAHAGAGGGGQPTPESIPLELRGTLRESGAWWQQEYVKAIAGSRSAA
jgi:hypothetical protein